jgi:chromosome segregation ATPase
MLRIEKERENVVKQLKKVQKITRELRSTLRKRDATIAEMKENERQRRQQQQMNHDDTNSDPTAAALKVASTILLRSESKEEENNECNRLKEKIVTLERKLLCSERRCQTAEALVVCTKKEVNTLREGRDKAEEVSKRAEERIIEVEKQIVEERKLRMNAEEISKDIESVIAKLQRQRDAAEALVKDLSGGGGGGGGGSGGNHNLALNSKTTLDTIKSLQDGLNESNKKLFLLAGIESKCKDLENENKSMEISIYESEEEIVRLENELAHIKKDRDGLREQRDIAEDVSEEVREERDRLSKKCKNLKLEIENIKMSNGAASGRSMSKNQLLREEEISKKEKTEWIEKSKLAKEREDKLQKAMSRAAEEVFNMMQSHREWLEKFEKVEQELGTYQIDTR